MFRDPPIRNDLVIKSNKRGFLFSYFIFKIYKWTTGRKEEKKSSRGKKVIRKEKVERILLDWEGGEKAEELEVGSTMEKVRVNYFIYQG